MPITPSEAIRRINTVLSSMGFDGEPYKVSESHCVNDDVPLWSVDFIDREIVTNHAAHNPQLDGAEVAHRMIGNPRLVPLVRAALMREGQPDDAGDVVINHQTFAVRVSVGGRIIVASIDLQERGDISDEESNALMVCESNALRCVCRIVDRLVLDAEDELARELRGGGPI